MADEPLRVNRDGFLHTRSSDNYHSFEVTFHEWAHLRKKAECLPRKDVDWKTGAWTSFGSSVSFGGALVALAFAPATSVHLVWFYASMTAVMFVAGLLCSLAARSESNRIIVEAKQLVADMDEIQARCPPLPALKDG